MVANSMKLHKLLAFVAVCMFSFFSNAQERIGTPQSFSKGVTVSMAEIRAKSLQMDKSPKIRKAREHESEFRKPIQNPEAIQTSTWPVVEINQQRTDGGNTAQRTAATQDLHSNFLGTQVDNSMIIPPDVSGDVSSTQICISSNWRLKFYNKPTLCDAALSNSNGNNTTVLPGHVVNVDVDAFFLPVLSPPTASNYTTDPHVRFDRLSQRWFIVAIDVKDASNRIMVAVSNSATVTSSSSFTFFYFVYDAFTGVPAGYSAGFLDYPTLGIDANALYIGGTVFNAAGTGQKNALFVVRKSSVLAAGPLVATAFFDVKTGTTAELFTPQGVHNDDPTATEGYFVSVDNISFGALDIVRISNPGGTPTLSPIMKLTVPATSFPIDQLHPGSTDALDGLDDRLYAAQLIKNKVTNTTSLWTAHNIGVNASGVASSATRNASRWYQVGNLTTTPTLTQSGTLFDNAASNPRGFWIPSIAQSGQGHSVLGFSTAGTAVNINCGIAGRYSSDVLGTLQPYLLATTATSNYNNAGDNVGETKRWGDYSQTVVDPADDMTIWSFQEYCNGTNSWGIRALQVKAPAPASPTALGTLTCGTSGQVNVIINGTSTNNTGFYDPGTGYAKRLNVTSSNGVTVSNISFVTPTQITATLNYTAATGLGTPFTLTVTNPDCQFATTTYTIPTACTLPLSWLDLTALWKNAKAEIIWKVANEQSNSHFEIERHNGDGKFEKVGEKAALNLPASTYTFVDENAGEVNFYRIKQIDLDGKYTYSKVVSLKRRGTDNLVVYPNPAKDFINIIIPQNSKKGTISVFAANGQLVKRISTNANIQYTISVKEFSKGIYSLEWKEADGRTIRQKVVVD